MDEPWFAGWRIWHDAPWKAGRHGGRRRWGPPPPPHPPGAPPPPPWFWDFFAPPPPRAERGEVRWLILDALRDGPRHGYEIIRLIEERSQGAYRPSPGTVYPTLQMLEEMDLVGSTDKDGKRVYQLTDAGRVELDSHGDDVEDSYARFSQASPFEAAREIKELARWLERLMRIVGRSVQRGRITADKRRAVEKIIREAATAIEDVLKG